ncbi:hypothetical protein L210DRAFT_939578, partial [Boletus edulis BED1]
MAIKKQTAPSHTKVVLPDLPAHRSSVAVARRRAARVRAHSTQARPIHKFTAQRCKFLRI